MHPQCRNTKTGSSQAGRTTRDKIYVTDDFSGSQTLSLKEINGLDSDPGIGQAAENTVLASVNGSGTFTADDQEGTLYWQRYELGQKDSAASGYTTD